MSKLAVLCFILAVLGAIVDQGVSAQKCTDTTAMHFFDPAKYGGQWFVQGWSVKGVKAPNAICMMRSLTLSEDKTWISLHVDYLESDGNHDADDYDYVLNVNANPAILDVADSPTSERHIVIATDYIHYSIWKSCFSIGNCEAYMIVTMTRSRRPKDEVNTNITKALSDASISDTLTKVQQTECWAPQ